MSVVTDARPRALSETEVRWLAKQVRYVQGYRSTPPSLDVMGERISSSQARYLRLLAKRFTQRNY